MEKGQGDLFDLEVLTYRPSDHIETRQHVMELLRPIAAELTRQNADPIGTAEAFKYFAAQFDNEAMQRLVGEES